MRFLRAPGPAPNVPVQHLGSARTRLQGLVKLVAPVTLCVPAKLGAPAALPVRRLSALAKPVHGQAGYRR